MRAKVSKGGQSVEKLLRKKPPPPSISGKGPGTTSARRRGKRPRVHALRRRENWETSGRRTRIPGGHCCGERRLIPLKLGREKEGTASKR